MKQAELLAKMAEVLEWQEETPLAPDTPLAEIWDSMGQINIISMLDEELDLALELDELEQIKTVRDILDIVRARNIILE